ncbi:hypothetical protein ABK040_007232 [Willaertia magna]
MSSKPSCKIEPLIESTNLFLNNNENFVIGLLGNNDKYLITKLDKYLEFKAFRCGLFILNKITGHVYFKCTMNMEILMQALGITYDKELQLLKFTIEDPIKQIITKFANCFAMISESGNAYVFSLDGGNIKQGLIPKCLFENEKVVQIACGGVHVLYLTENNKLFGTGGEYDGNAISYSREYSSCTKNEFRLVKCNVEALEGKKIKQIAATYNCSFALTVENELYSCGYCGYAANGQPEEVKNCPFFTKVKDNVERVIAGYFFVAIKTLGGEYFIFGYNNCYQFGEIDGILMTGNKIYGTNTKLTTFNIHDIEQLECGGYHSIIVSKSDDVYFTGHSHCNAFLDCTVKLELKQGIILQSFTMKSRKKNLILTIHTKLVI